MPSLEETCRSLTDFAFGRVRSTGELPDTYLLIKQVPSGRYCCYRVTRDGQQRICTARTTSQDLSILSAESGWPDGVYGVPWGTSYGNGRLYPWFFDREAELIRICQPPRESPSIALDDL